MLIRIISLIIFGTASVLLADTAVQTDWSGGRWIWGPAGEWGDQFHLEDNIEWDSGPGVIQLQYNAESVIDEDFGGASSVFTEDIDGDGDLDVLGAAYSDHEITWWENTDGFGGSWIEHTIDGDFSGANSVYSEDLDGDGDMDVLGTAYHISDISWWENVDGSGTSWVKHIIDDNYLSCFYIYSDDLNGDGDMDVICSSIWGNSVAVWENNDGSGTSWIKHTVDSGFYGARSVYTEDINGDGYTDILGAAYSDDDITWWENADGSGTSWIEHIVDGDFNGACSAHSEDMDNDGDMDILGAASTFGRISWWENTDGTGISWIEHTVEVGIQGAECVYMVDFDNDGDFDILGLVAWPDYYISWWENNNGSGTSWTEHSVIDGSFIGAESVYPVDMNCDGDMDVLGAISYRDIIWWDYGKYPYGGCLESSCLYLHNDPGWGYIDWNAQEPANTAVAFQVRSCDTTDVASMGSWSDTLYTPCSLTGILDEYDSFFQYRAILLTSDSTTTPTLEDVCVTWNPVSIEEESPVTESILFGAEPNPSCGSVSIRFALPELSQVELSVYSLSGRLVSTVSQEEYSQGVHNVQIGELIPGIYFCRMSAGDFTTIQSFVVIE